jgi:hypothetical protein
MRRIVEDIGTVVNSLRYTINEDGVIVRPTTLTPEEEVRTPYYMYGHRLEIANRLMLKDRDKAQKREKYPLFALRLDTVEEIDSNETRVKLNIGIFNYTDKNYSAEDRYVNVFWPILYPLYGMFKDAVFKSGLFFYPGRDPKHKKIDRPFWGISQTEGNSKYIFSDPLDAIELVDLELNLVTKKC